MNLQVAGRIPDRELRGLHVVTSLPPSKKDRTKYLMRVLEAAKERWGWKVSVICDNIDRRPFEKLAAPDGQIFLRPFVMKAEAWERDPEEVAATERKMRKAEAVAALPAGRVVLASGHNVGRAYNFPFVYPKRTPLMRRLFKDNMMPFGILRRFYRFSDETLAAVDADLILVFEWAAPLNYLLCWLAGRNRGVPAVSFRYSKINGRHAYWTTHRFGYNVAAIEKTKAKEAKKAPTSNTARQQIQTFRDQPKVVNYIADKWKNRMQRGFVRWHLEWARIVIPEIINTFRGQDRFAREPGWARFERHYRTVLLSFYHQRFFRAPGEDELANTKYIYFPMHKEAEMAQTFQSTTWHDQRNTIRVLASSLPFGYRLLVRGHRMNFGRRPTRVYHELSKIPNVTLIDPFDSQFKYLRHADLIITENGSSGWEGILLGRRVLLLSDTFYDGTGDLDRVTDPDQLGRAIQNSLSKPLPEKPGANDKACARRIDAEFDTTFPYENDDMPAALDHLAKAVTAAIRYRQKTKTKAE